MAKVAGVLVMVVIYIAATAVAPSKGQIAPQPADDKEAALPPQAPSDGDNAPAPSPEDGFLETCVKNFDDACGQQVFDGVFGNKTVTDGCCKNLVQMGKPCHDELVQRALDIPSIKVQVDESQVLSQSDRIWSQCVSSSS